MPITMEAQTLTSPFVLVPGALVLAMAVHWFCKPLFEWQQKKNRPVDESERTFFDPKTNELIAFPSLHSPAEIFISLIAPAYNEEERIPEFFEETLRYLISRQASDPSYTWEIIVVDDGSKDRTCDIVMGYVRKHGADKIRLLKLARNCGKGGAVTRGFGVARGKYVLMVDADAATDITDLKTVEERMFATERNSEGVCVGSRAHLAETAVAKRAWYRNILMHGFHLVVMICVRGIQDTQCGFKLFSRKAAQKIFPSCHISGWCFDVELLYIAQALRIPTAEVAVNWTEIPGSKVPITAPLYMGRDIVLIRLAYLLGIWKVKSQ